MSPFHTFIFPLWYTLIICHLRPASCSVGTGASFRRRKSVEACKFITHPHVVLYLHIPVCLYGVHRGIFTLYLYPCTPAFPKRSLPFRDFDCANVSQPFFCSWPPTIRSRSYLWKERYFISTLLTCIRICLYYLQYCIFLNISFRYNTLFTYTSTNILLISGIIVSVFLVPDEHLQVFEWPVAV
jgi:hypothetical protein